MSIQYHGSASRVTIDMIEFNRNKRLIGDFGLGFYVGPELDIAREWASHKALEAGARKDAVVNVFGVDDQMYNDLDCLDFLDGTHTVIEWMATLAKYRRPHASFDEQINNDDYEWLKQFAIDTDDYQVIRSYRADDHLSNIWIRFLRNQIDIRGLKYALAAGRFGEQDCWKDASVLNYVCDLASITVPRTSNEIDDSGREISIFRYNSDYSTRVSNAERFVMSLQSDTELLGLTRLRLEHIINGNEFPPQIWDNLLIERK